MTKGEYIKYAIQKTVSEYSFLEWLEMWDIEEKDWNKFISEGSRAVSQEESEEEQEPCSKDINVSATDYISRQAAIDALGECPMNWMDSYAEIVAERDWKDTVEMLNSLPSVTPQSKTGHWILANNQSKEDVLNDNYRFICSECKCSDIHAKGIKVPYCWKCGSKMGVEE